jgi:hypothetical protein
MWTHSWANSVQADVEDEAHLRHLPHPLSEFLPNFSHQGVHGHFGDQFHREAYLTTRAASRAANSPSS